MLEYESRVYETRVLFGMVDLMITFIFVGILLLACNYKLISVIYGKKITWDEKTITLLPLFGIYSVSIVFFKPSEMQMMLRLAPLWFIGFVISILIASLAFTTLLLLVIAYFSRQNHKTKRTKISHNPR